jgi:hypothetical protein
MGWQNKNLNDDYSIQGRNYQTYGFSTPSGNVAGNIVVQNGMKVIVPDLTGTSTYSSTSGITKARRGTEILAQTPVEIKQTKIQPTEETVTKTSEYNSTKTRQ